MLGNVKQGISNLRGPVRSRPSDRFNDQPPLALTWDDGPPRPHPNSLCTHTEPTQKKEKEKSQKNKKMLWKCWNNFLKKVSTKKFKSKLFRKVMRQIFLEKWCTKKLNQIILEKLCTKFWTIFLKSYTPKFWKKIVARNIYNEYYQRHLEAKKIRKKFMNQYIQQNM
jgi:hypothetical protein